MGGKSKAAMSHSLEIEDKGATASCALSLSRVVVIKIIIIKQVFH